MLWCDYLQKPTKVEELNPWFFPVASSLCNIAPGSNHDFMSSIYRVVISSPVVQDSTFPFSDKCVYLHEFQLVFLWHNCFDVVFFLTSSFKGLFGFKEVGGSKELGKCYFSLSYLSKHQKRKMRKPLFLLHNHFLTSKMLQLILWSCKSHL